MAKGRPPPAFLTKGKGKAPPFERSKRDVEPRGMREGSPREEAYDRQQMGPPAFRGGGKVKRK